MQNKLSRQQRAEAEAREYAKWNWLCLECNIPVLHSWALDRLIESCGNAPYTVPGREFYKRLINERYERDRRAL